MIEIKPYVPEYLPLWEAFVSKAKNATFLLSRHFMDYHQERFEDHSLACFKDGKMIAVLPANLVGDTLYSHQGLTYGGLLVLPTLKTDAYLDLCKELLQFLHEKQIRHLVLKNLPAIYEDFPSDEIRYLQFITKAERVRNDLTSVVSLHRRIPYSKNRRRAVVKGRQGHFKFEELAEFDAFWEEVLTPNLNKTHGVSPVHSLQEITMLKSKFPDSIRQFNVYKEGEILAGATIFESENVAHAQYISATDKGNEMAALDFLFDCLLQEVFKEKRFFDFGISNESKGLKLNKGLLYWKEGFGARSVSCEVYKIPTENYTNLSSLDI